jgi:hypothetical protein
MELICLDCTTSSKDLNKEMSAFVCQGIITVNIQTFLGGRLTEPGHHAASIISSKRSRGCSLYWQLPLNMPPLRSIAFRTCLVRPDHDVNLPYSYSNNRTIHLGMSCASNLVVMNAIGAIQGVHPKLTIAFHADQ